MKEVEPVKKITMTMVGRGIRDAAMSFAGSTSGAVHLK